jgi:hypothetical protein
MQLVSVECCIEAMGMSEPHGLRNAVIGVAMQNRKVEQSSISTSRSRVGSKSPFSGDQDVLRWQWRCERIGGTTDRTKPRVDLQIVLGQ